MSQRSEKSPPDFPWRRRQNQLNNRENRVYDSRKPFICICFILLLEHPLTTSEFWTSSKAIFAAKRVTHTTTLIFQSKEPIWSLPHILLYLQLVKADQIFIDIPQPCLPLRPGRLFSWIHDVWTSKLWRMLVRCKCMWSVLQARWFLYVHW